MGRTAAIAVTAAIFGAIGAGMLPAQEIFWDGFEYGDLCAWSNPPVFKLADEAFDASGSNEDYVGFSDAELIPGRCLVLEGTIGEPYDPPGPVDLEFDVDVYELALQGPALAKIRVERFGASSAVKVYADLSNSSDYGLYGFFPDPLVPGDPSVLEREIYLPENGFDFLDPDPAGSRKDLPSNNKWFLVVDDERNYGDVSCPCGGADDTYRITLTIESVAGPQGPFPDSNRTIVYPWNGPILRYRIPDGVATAALTETILDQLNPGFSDLDTRLFLVKKVGTRIETVKGSDDWEYEVGSAVHTDSRIGSTLLTAEPHFVVFDNFATFGTSDIDVGLTIQYIEPLHP